MVKGGGDGLIVDGVTEWDMVCVSGVLMVPVEKGWDPCIYLIAFLWDA